LKGLPPYELTLKVGAIVMLLRNMNVAHGLLNGTRLIVRSMYTNALELEVITGVETGQKNICRSTLLVMDNSDNCM